MSNIYVIPDNEKDINKLLNKDIQGIILGVTSLSIYPLEQDIDKIIEIKKNTEKKVYVIINKMIHNKDLSVVEDVLIKIKHSTIDGIIFCDVGVLNIIKKIGIDKELILSMEHQNASIESNNFYRKRGITGSIITNDITLQEVLDIKNNTSMNIFYTVYGYLPIFYSRRGLITNYLKYINKPNSSTKYYIYNDNLKYMIIEKDYGTIIYSPLINMINELDKLSNIDNLIIDLSYNNDISIIDKYLNKEHMSNTYTGFFDKKTIYKLRGGNNE